jgi:hypothetical protein
MTGRLTRRGWGSRGRRPDNRGDVAPFAPDAVNVGVHHVQLGPTEWVATLVVTGYPRDVHAGWLAPFTQHPGRVDVCLHVIPIDPATAASRLRRQLARLESGRRSGTEHPATRPAHRRRHHGTSSSTIGRRRCSFPAFFSSSASSRSSLTSWTGTATKVAVRSGHKLVLQPVVRDLPAWHAGCVQQTRRGRRPPVRR